MHAQHAQGQGMVLGDDALGHDGGGHRRHEHLRQLQHLRGGVGPDGPSADQQQRPLGVLQQLDRLEHAGEVLVGRGHRELLVQQHCPAPRLAGRPPGGRCAPGPSVRSLAMFQPRLIASGRFARVQHPEVVLGDGHHQAEDVRLLEGVVPDLRYGGPDRSARSSATSPRRPWPRRSPGWSPPDRRWPCTPRSCRWPGRTRRPCGPRTARAGPGRGGWTSPRTRRRSAEYIRLDIRISHPRHAFPATSAKPWSLSSNLHPFPHNA